MRETLNTKGVGNFTVHKRLSSKPKSNDESVILSSYTNISRRLAEIYKNYVNEIENNKLTHFIVLTT